MPIFNQKPEHDLGNLPKQTSRKLANGSAGNKQTVKFMIKVARQRAGHPMVRRLAENIVNTSRTKSMNYRDEAKAIANFVKYRVKYLKDPRYIEQVTDPVTMIERIKAGKAVGDCDDMALLIITLLLSIGHSPQLKIVRYKGKQSGYQHIYVVEKVGNYKQKPTWLSMDAIVKDKPIGFEVKYSKAKLYKV